MFPGSQDPDLSSQSPAVRRIQVYRRLGRPRKPPFMLSSHRDVSLLKTRFVSHPALSPAQTEPPFAFFAAFFSA